DLRRLDVRSLVLQHRHRGPRRFRDRCGNFAGYLLGTHHHGSRHRCPGRTGELVAVASARAAALLAVASRTRRATNRLAGTHDACETREAERSGTTMKKILARVTALVTVSATGCFGVGTASADDTPAGGTPTPGTSADGTAYGLGGAQDPVIPYDEYGRRLGAGWFPGLKREIVDYPAGQVQG